MGLLSKIADAYSKAGKAVVIAAGIYTFGIEASLIPVQNSKILNPAPVYAQQLTELSNYSEYYKNKKLPDYSKLIEQIKRGEEYHLKLYDKNRISYSVEVYRTQVYDTKRNNIIELVLYPGDNGGLETIIYGSKSVPQDSYADEGQFDEYTNYSLTLWEGFPIKGKPDYIGVQKIITSFVKFKEGEIVELNIKCSINREDNSKVYSIKSREYIDQYSTNEEFKKMVDNDYRNALNAALRIATRTPQKINLNELSNNDTNGIEQSKKGKESGNKIFKILKSELNQH